MKINQLILLLLLSFISCNLLERKERRDLKMPKFVKCVSDQVEKEYLEGPNSNGPSIFSNEGLIFFCRETAGFSKPYILFDSSKNSSKPERGAYAYAFTEGEGEVSHEFLGVVIDTYPTLVVSGDPEKGVLTSHPLLPKPEYSRIEFHYIDS